jgi:hypothetical protein
VKRFDSGGHLVVLPWIDLQADQEDEDGTGPDDDEFWVPEAEQFQLDLLTAVVQLGGSDSISRPQWADNYATKEQARLRLEVEKREKQVERAHAGLERAQKQKEASELKNQLFLGSGRTLELEVKKVLERLGGEVTEPPANRDDWKVIFPEGHVVCEAKGVTKSAAEKHAAQLEKWVSSEYSETGVSPKGLLVVNAWRDTPLIGRVEADFPAQMLPYCRSRGHCLISGLQLFVILADIEDNPDRADHWRSEILATNGAIEGCGDWRSVLDSKG